MGNVADEATKIREILQLSLPQIIAAIGGGGGGGVVNPLEIEFDGTETAGAGPEIVLSSTTGVLATIKAEIVSILSGNVYSGRLRIQVRRAGVMVDALVIEGSSDEESTNIYIRHDNQLKLMAVEAGVLILQEV